MMSPTTTATLAPTRAASEILPAPALRLVDHIVVHEDERVEQFQRQRGAQQGGIGKGARPAKDAKRRQQQHGADALAAPAHEFADVEVERLKQVAVGVALGVFLEETGEERLKKRRGVLQFGSERGVRMVHAVT
jgi:hypothetical protein